MKKSDWHEMPLEDKIAFCSGASFWKTKAYEDYGISSMFVCDGPHGLRKQTGEGDHLGLNASVQSTCFPTASALASTWDLELLGRIGAALGLEAVKERVNVILGPGVNMKRNPLCGRNFEYFSEDPLLAGKLAAAWIQGVQEQGIGVSLKHFAGNNQEQKRMSSDSLIDERALREYYLKAFEIAVKEAEPMTVMCAYNKLNGVYCSDHKELLTDILREEWGFGGAVMTDWGAMNDRISGFRAGLDLEMPGSRGRFDREVREAVRNGQLKESYIDQSVERLYRLQQKTMAAFGSKPVPDDLMEQNHKLAKEAALSAGVLLKNEEEVLPLGEQEPFVLIGELARTPRYQGTGSSLVSASRVTNLLEELGSIVPGMRFAAGYTLADEPDEALKEEAVRLVKNAGKVVLCIGLTDIYESEGFDREHMRLPENQLAVLQAAAAVNSDIIVVLCGGAAVEMPWETDVKAILHMQLSGQGGGQAAAELLLGRANPSGRLAESYPYRYEDVVNSSYYKEEPKQAVYYESMFAGYRYFESAGVSVRYPFGYGLSYTEFCYHDMRTERNGDKWRVCVTVENIGSRDGAEVVQLYSMPEMTGCYRPARELIAFKKVPLKAGEKKTVSFSIAENAMAVYDPKRKRWCVERGTYKLGFGRNCHDIVLQDEIRADGEKPVRQECSSWYHTLKGIPGKADFITIYGKYEPYQKQTKGTYDMTSSIKEMKETSWICRIMYKAMEKMIAQANGGKIDYSNVQFRMLMDSASDNPMKSMPLFSPERMPVELSQFFVDAANGHIIKGVRRLLKRKV